MQTLTDRQQQVLRFIQSYIGEHGGAPTRVEIAQALGFQSPNTAEFHLKALVRKGYIELSAGRNRNIRLLLSEPGKEQENNTDSEGLPLVGHVAAGSPIFAQEHIQGYYGFNDLFGGRPDYLLKVRGMSMRDAGILDGDLLAVRSTSQAQNGQIVVARLEDEVTVKRLEIDRKQIRLLPANPDFMPIVVNPEKMALVIEGIAVGVIRSGKL
jgi:repressor LexA